MYYTFLFLPFKLISVVINAMNIITVFLSVSQANYTCHNMLETSRYPDAQHVHSPFGWEAKSPMYASEKPYNMKFIGQVKLLSQSVH